MLNVYIMKVAAGISNSWMHVIFWFTYSALVHFWKFIIVHANYELSDIKLFNYVYNQFHLSTHLKLDLWA